jgi:hypothetical protein
LFLNIVLLSSSQKNLVMNPPSYSICEMLLLDWIWLPVYLLAWIKHWQHSDVWNSGLSSLNEFSSLILDSIWLKTKSIIKLDHYMTLIWLFLFSASSC